MKPIFIGSDHAGFKLKQELKKYLTRKKIVFIDAGNTVLNPKDDYPDYGILVAKAVAQTKSIGILVCGTSYGVCIVANKVKGIRAVSISTVGDAKKSREHNDANVLCLSGWNTSVASAQKIVDAFIKTKKSNQARHARRLAKIIAIEKQNLK